MRIRSRETWSDGSVVGWSVKVREIPMEGELLDEYYDRDCKSNREVIADGGVVRAFIVEEVLEEPDEDRSNSEEEPITGCEFLGVDVGDTLVLLMNHKEYVEKLYGNTTEDFDDGPTLLNIQDCGFNVALDD